MDPSEACDCLCGLAEISTEELAGPRLEEVKSPDLLWVEDAIILGAMPLNMENSYWLAGNDPLKSLEKGSVLLSYEMNELDRIELIPADGEMPEISLHRYTEGGEWTADINRKISNKIPLDAAGVQKACEKLARELKEKGNIFFDAAKDIVLWNLPVLEPVFEQEKAANTAAREELEKKIEELEQGLENLPFREQIAAAQSIARMSRELTGFTDAPVPVLSGPKTENPDSIR